MDIPINTEVRCTDGPVGKSTYIIVDLVTERVTHFVIKTKQHSREYLVPLDKVKNVSREAIQLNFTKVEISELTPFNASYFNGYDAYETAPLIPSDETRAGNTLYHPYRTAETGGEGSGKYTSSQQLAVNKGAAILATDGSVGKVDELVIDPETYQITHLVLREHELIKELLVTIPVSEIERIEMETVYLKIDKNEVASLPTETLKKFPWE